MFHNQTLTLPEMLLLDGRCSPKLQAEVDRAKEAKAIANRHGLEDGAALFIRDAVAEARTHGKLVYDRLPVTRCSYSGRTGEWVRPPQGRARYPKDPWQRTFLAVNVARRFIVVKHHASLGIDAEIFDRLLPALRKELHGIRAEIPEAILGEPCAWRYSARAKAKCCGWEGAELLTHVRRDPHWFGLTCPGCGKRHRSDWGSSVNFSLVPGEHDLVAVADLRDQTNLEPPAAASPRFPAGPI